MLQWQTLIGLVGAFLLMTCFGAPVRAAEWSAAPTLSIRGEYNSNLLITSAPHDEVWEVWASPAVKFAGSTENLDVSGRVAGDFVQFYGGQNRSITNLFVPLTVRYNTEREVWKLEGGFTRDNTLMGELSQTGVVVGFTQRNMWSVSPSWEHNLTERTSLLAGYQFSDAKYEDGLRLGLVDYTVNGGNAGVGYKLTEKDRVDVTGIYTNFHAPQASNLRSEIYGLQGSVTLSLSEAWTGTLAGGPRLVVSSTQAGTVSLEDTQTVWVGSGMLRRAFESGSVQLEASREIYPSGFGFLLATDRVGVTLTREVTERVSASLNASAYLASSIATTANLATFPENRYVVITPRVAWKIGEWWSLDVAYTYSRRDVPSFNELGISHDTWIMLTYSPSKLSMGR